MICINMSLIRHFSPLRHTYKMNIIIIIMCMIISSIECNNNMNNNNQHARLSVPRVLLPTQHGVLYKLQVTSSSSCYTWNTPRDGIVSLRPLYDNNGCSRSAIVQAARKQEYKVTAIILVQDTHTEEVLRCDVIIDKIISLELVTTTRELFVEEAPEKFEVRAYDDQGNEFTTLEGIEFTWTVNSPLKDNDVIRLITFADSPYEAPEELKKLEAEGLRGHVALLEGTRTGSAIINVRLPQPEHAKVKPVEVTLRVIANLLISPPDASILLGDRIYFKVIQVREGKLIEVSFPSPQYSLKIENDLIASLNSYTGLTEGQKLGTTNIILHDAGEGTDAEGSSLPKALLRVVEPHSISILLKPAPPSKPWSIQVNHHCSIQANIYDQENNLILIGSETQISIEVKSEFFSVQSKTSNGSIISGIPQKPGVMKITAKLISVAGKTLSRKIATTADVHIFDKIQIIPNEVILPWYPSMKSKNEIHLNAIGGDGSYQWRHEGSSISVNNRGLVTAFHLGEGKVFANMPANPHINDTAKVWVLEPADMEIVWSDNEGAVGETLALHVALYGEKVENSRHVPFNSCDKVAFEVSNVDGSIFEKVDKKRDSDTKLQGDACIILFVKCTNVGRGRVMIQQRSLRKTVALTCFDPLQRVFPTTQHKSLLLTVGSSSNVIYTGGFISNIDHLDIRREVSSVKKDLINLEINNNKCDQKYHVFTVTCLDLGETEVSFKIYKNSYENILLTETIFDVVCATPHSVKLSVRNSQGLECPVASTSQLNSIKTSAELEITIVDSENRIFHNASSLALSWSAKPANIVRKLPSGFLLEKLDDKFETIPVLNYHYQILKLSEASSPNEIVEITIEINNYINDVLKHAGVKRAHKFSSFLKAVLPIKLIKPININFDQLFVYNYPGNIRKVNLLNGSGFFKLEASSNEFAIVELNNGILTIQPVYDGVFTVTIIDLCLDAPPAVVNVEIVNIQSIEAELPPLIEQGQNVSCQIWAYSKLESRLPIDDSNAPSLTYHILEGHITIEHVPQVISNGAANFIITGLNEGEIRVQFSMGSATDIACSRVFSPLRIEPPEAIIMPGAHIRLVASGGPPPPAIVKFYHVQGSGRNVAKISLSGDVDGLAQGIMEVECRAESDGVVLSKAVGVVNVIQLEGVQIFAPVTTLLTGHTIPIYALGIPDSLGPDILGSIAPSLQFHWYISGDGAAVISDILVNTNIDLNDFDRVSVRLTALREGRITIHLVVTGKTGLLTGGDFNYKASYDLSLIEPLKILSPANSLPPLLLALNSTVDLRTNYAHEDLKFTLSSVDSASNKVVKISQDGKLTSFNQLGHAIVTISTVDSQIGMKQVVFLPIEVCSVQYVMASINDNTIGQYLENMAGLPRDLKLAVKLLQYDALGRPIVGNTVKIRARTLRPHLLNFYYSAIDTVDVELYDVGTSILRVSDKSVDKIGSDYIPLKVQTTVHPQEIVATVGDVWCMSTIIGNGTWNSLDERALFVDPETGLCQAKVSLPDNTEAQFVHPKIKTSSYVSIVPLEKIWFLEGGGSMIVTDEKPFVFSLVLGKNDEHDTRKMNNLISEDGNCLENAKIKVFPFKCHISPVNEQKLYDIVVSSVFDPITGTYGCQVDWNPPKSEKYYTNETKHQINVWAQSKTVSSRQLKVSLLHAAIAPKVLQLYDVITPLDVTGPFSVLDQVKISPVSKSLTISSSERVSDNLKRFYVKLVKNDFYTTESYLILHSSLTKQSSKIKVIWTNMGRGSDECSGSGSPILNLTRDYLVPIVTLAIAFLTLLAFYKFFSTTHVIAKKDNYIPVMTPPPTTPPSFVSPSRHFNVSQSSLLSSSGSPSTLQPDFNSSTVYGDPSYLASPERRRNRRNNLFL